MLNASRLFRPMDGALRRFKSGCERHWKSKWFGWTFLLTAGITSLYLFLHVPSPGVAVSVLAVVAAVITFLERIEVLQKLLWIPIFVVFFCVEVRAIHKDRSDFAEQQATTLTEERKNFSRVLKSQEDGFKKTLQQEQLGFESTLKGQIEARADERAHFSSVLSQGEGVFKHQQELAESLTEELLPGSGATPPNNCDVMPAENRQKDDLLILVGKQSYVTNKFPHTILQISSVPLLQIDRTPDGAIAVIADIRGSDGRLIARMNKLGIIVNEANKLRVVKEPHKIVIDDQYGNEVLNVEYVNSKTLKIDALTYYKSSGVQLSNPVKGSSFETCSAHSVIDIYIE